MEEGIAAFLKHGYHGTGLKEVLDRVQVPKGSFYNYFENKEQFAVAAIGYYSGCLTRKLSDSLKAESDPLKGLRRFFKTLMDEFKAAGFVGGCLVGNLSGELEGSELCREALASAMSAWRDGVRDALQEAQKLETVRNDIAAGDLADHLIDAWEGAVLRMKIERSLKPLQQCLRRLLDGYFRA